MPRTLSQSIGARPTAAGAPAFPSSQLFTTSGTFTVPSGVSLVYVTGCGGGGGGGGSNPAPNMAGGGGGASVLRRPVAVTPGASLAVTVGAAGAAGAAGGSPGGNGGSTSLGALLTVVGGAGGSSTPGVGGASQTATFLHPQRAVDAPAVQALSQLPFGAVIAGEGGAAANTGVDGRGGMSFFSALMPTATPGTNPASPTGFGSGGSGRSNGDGVAGQPGFLLVEW